jgi:hypothetical protein
MSRNSDRLPRPVVLSLVPAVTGPADAVRPDRVQAARARIADGYYEREDVQRALAEALLAELVTTP